MIHSLRTYGNSKALWIPLGFFFFTLGVGAEETPYAWYLYAGLIATISSAVMQAASAAGRDCVPRRNALLGNSALASFAVFVVGAGVAHLILREQHSRIVTAGVIYAASIAFVSARSRNPKSLKRNSIALSDMFARSQFSANVRFKHLCLTTSLALAFSLGLAWALPETVNLFFPETSRAPLEISILIFVSMSFLSIPLTMRMTKHRHTLSWNGIIRLRRQGWITATVCFVGMMIATTSGFLVARGRYFDVDETTVAIWALSIASGAAGSFLLAPHGNGGKYALWCLGNVVTIVWAFVATLSFSLEKPAHTVPPWTLCLLGAGLLVVGAIYWHRKTSGKHDVLDIYAGA